MTWSPHRFIGKQANALNLMRVEWLLISLFRKNDETITRYKLPTTFSQLAIGPKNWQKKTFLRDPGFRDMLFDHQSYEKSTDKLVKLEKRHACNGNFYKYDASGQLAKRFSVVVK